MQRNGGEGSAFDPSIAFRATKSAKVFHPFRLCRLPLRLDSGMRFGCPLDSEGNAASSQGEKRMSKFIRTRLGHLMVLGAGLLSTSAYISAQGVSGQTVES